MSKRNTVQREFILDAVRNSCDHPSAETIYERVKGCCEHISLGTVYRNLNRLSEEGEILKLEVAGAPDRFDKTLENHYHIYCSSCGCFEDIMLPYQSKIDYEARKVSGYSIGSHSIIFRGLCPQCIEKG